MTEPPPHLKVQRRASREICPFCRDDLSDYSLHTCDGCQATHHLTCWNLHGGCSSCTRTGRVRVPHGGKPYVLSDERRAELRQLATADRASFEERRQYHDRLARFKFTVWYVLFLVFWFYGFGEEIGEAVDALLGGSRYWVFYAVGGGLWTLMLLMVSLGWVLHMQDPHWRPFRTDDEP